MYNRSAAIYDAIYAKMKNYQQETERLDDLIKQYKRSEGKKLLDVACGTGAHLSCLKSYYEVEGMDLSERQLAVARQREPTLTLHQGDMQDFDLGKQFDIVTCLFSSIGYTKTMDGLLRAIATMVRHLNPGGVLIIEPWLYPDAFRTGSVHATFVDEPELKIARMTVSEREGNVSIMDMHHMVATPHGVETFVERHEMGLFSHQEYSTAFQQNGLTMIYDEQGLMGRGLYIGRMKAEG